MIISESIYFIIMFSIPAALQVLYNAYLKDVTKRQNDKSIELAECFVFCIAVFVVNMVVNFLSMKDDFNTFLQYGLANEENKQAILTSNADFNYMNYLLTYTILTGILSVVTIFAWNLLLKKFVKKAINCSNRKRGRKEELDYSDVWSNIFETNDLLDAYGCCVVIKESGTMISAGAIKSHSAPTIENKELLLYNTDVFMDILKQDEFREVNDKIFFPPIFEYHNFVEGITLEFYSLSKYMDVFINKE